MNINIIEFCKFFKINWQPINLIINPKTKKKNISKCFCNDGYNYMPKPNDFTKNLISIDELNKRQSYLKQFNYIAIDTSDFYHIDVDDNKYIDKVQHLLTICPYFLSSTKKLPHIIYKSKHKYFKNKCETIYKYNNDNQYINPIEILSGLWSYCHKNEFIINFSNQIPELNIDFIKLDTNYTITNNNDINIKNNTNNIQLNINNNKSITNNEINIKSDTNNEQLNINNNKSITNNEINIKSDTNNEKLNINNKFITNNDFKFDKDKFEFIKKLEICYKNSRIEIYDDWLNLLFAYKNELGEYGYESFDNLSKQITNKNKYNKDENLKIWNNTKIRTFGKRKTLYHIIKWAREDNEKKFNIIIDNNNFFNFININHCEKDIAIYIIQKFLKNNFICSDVKNLQFYFFNGVRWIEDFNNIKLYKIITEELVDDYNNIKIFFNNDKQIKLIDKIIFKLKGKISYFNNIIEHISLLLYNSNFLNIIDENPDLIGFDDYIYDLVNKIHRKGKHDDYITKSVGFNFPTHYTSYKNNIHTFLSQVFPNINVKNYVLQQHSQALSGRKGKDIIHTNTGIGGNGKTILIELLKYTFGQYYFNIPIKMLISQNNNNSNHNTPEPFFTKFKGIRFASSSEPPDGASINDSFFKLIASQEQQEYRILFSNVINKLNIQFKLHIFCNDKLHIKGDDGGIARRMKVINYISRFDENYNESQFIFKIDYSLADTVKLWKADYIKILIDLYDVNYIYTSPIEIDEASKLYIEDNNQILLFIKEFFIFTNSSEHFLLFKDIKQLYKNNKDYDQSKIKDFKNLLQKNMNTIIFERKKINNIDYRGVITGWTYIFN